MQRREEQKEQTMLRRQAYNLDRRQLQPMGQRNSNCSLACGTRFLLRMSLPGSTLLRPCPFHTGELLCR